MARILVVDDQLPIVKMLESLLLSNGHQVTIAKDTFDALDKLKDQGFEMIVSDVVMPPGPNGYELVKTIRNDVNHKDALVIMLTGRREKKDVERGIQSGVDDYCVKPVDPDLFVAKVAALLEKKFATNPAFSESPASEEAEIKQSLRIVGVSEVGLSFHSNQPFQPGTKIKIDSGFFDRLGIDSPNLRVMGCESKPEQFVVRAQFIGMNEQSLQPLRIWIRSRALSKAV